MQKGNQVTLPKVTAEQYENYFLATDRKAHLQMTISVTPWKLEDKGIELTWNC